MFVTIFLILNDYNQIAKVIFTYFHFHTFLSFLTIYAAFFIWVCQTVGDIWVNRLKHKLIWTAF